MTRARRARIREEFCRQVHRVTLAPDSVARIVVRPVEGSVSGDD